MAKVLIIDKQEERRHALLEKLQHFSSSVAGISMINSDNFHLVELDADILILLDQDPEFVLDLLHTEVLANKTIVTDINPTFTTTTNVIVLNPEDNIEELIFKAIAAHNQDIDTDGLPIAIDPKSKAILEMARKAAKTQATVLIHGETGVGKEVMAQYIHRHSSFSKGPFVSINCAALPDNMIESILFGYEKGAFTSAVNSYVGKFEQAQHGTLLLDEISEISIGLQAKLLRVLQEREIERLGGKKMIKINTRIIAATNRDLKQQVAAGLFRKDLYYRLNVIPMYCSPLRERKSDILPLAEFFVRKHTQLLNLTTTYLAESAKEKLMAYSWPGNIREMENVIQRALIMTDKKCLEASDIILNESFIDSINQDVVVDINLFHSKLEESEAKLILDVLRETEGCRNDAAKKLNISPRTLRHKIAKLKSIGIDVP